MNKEINKIISWIEMSYTRLNYKEELLLVNYIKQLQQENKQLKYNWNKLKEIIDVKMYNSEYLLNLCGYKIDADTLAILKIIKEEMLELEKGDSNE